MAKGRSNRNRYNRIIFNSNIGYDPGASSYYGGSAPMLIGEVITNDFTEVNWIIEDGGLTAWGFNPSNIQVIGTGGSFTPLIRYNQWFSQSENFTFRARYKVTLSNQVFLGVGIKVVSAFSSGRDFYAYMSTANSDNGAIYIYKRVGGTSSIIAQDTVNVVAYSLNTDEVEVNFTVNENVFTATFQNITTAGPVRTITYTETDPLSNPAISPTLPTIFQPAFQCARGNYTITEWDFTLNNFKNIDLLFIGDSKTEGYYADIFDNRFSNLWQAANPTKKVQVSAGSGNTTQDILNNMPEILLQAPRKVILFIGRNDIGSGILSATWQANYASIVNQLQAAGIQVWHQLPTPEGSLDQSALTTFINATYTNVISVPTGYTNASDNEDGVHPNIAGNLKIYNNQATFFSI